MNLFQSQKFFITSQFALLLYIFLIDFNYIFIDFYNLTFLLIILDYFRLL